MELNPYQSPEPGNPKMQERLPTADPVVQLLTEMRDMQRESLEFSREARRTLQRQQKYRAFPVVMMMVVAMAISGWTIYQAMSLRRPTLPPLPRAARVVPAPVAPPTAPATFPAPQ